ncbi:restriction endonuclease subunit S [Flavobacterium sp. PL12]|uniref:restriction endonuclease subunit S n=1 Tax=Flavobacterium sp. PL12 TaxID=3071718 RepID=UPI00319E2FCC
MNTPTQHKVNYKNSPVGLIPEDWEVKKFKDILKEGKLGGNYENSEANEGVPVMKMGNLGRGVVNLNKIQFLPDNEKYNEDDILKEGDLLFNTRNTLDLVGKVSMWRNELPFSLYNSNLMRMIFRVEDVGSNNFMNFAFNSHYLLSQLRGIATGTTSVAAIYGKDLNKIKFLLPSKEEQTAIANCLSTWDKAIATQTQLIAQKELRKKALANRLLTGNVRLKGFEKVKWVEKKADAIFRNNTDKTHNGELEILSASQERGIVPRSSNNIDIKYDENSLVSYKKVEIGDYVISLRSFQGGIEYSEYEGIVSPAYTILKEIIPISKVFYKVYFKTETFINRLNTIIYGIRDGKQISFKDFATLKLPHPSIEEQTAIAKVLQCADEEIQLLKKKLQQLKDQKKGLMQVLLTGKKRLEF